MNMMSISYCLLIILLVTPKIAAQGDLSTSQGAEILQELRQIRKLLEAKTALPSPSPSTNITLDVGDAPLLGQKEAPLTIVEFTDYQCPFCRRFNSEIFSELKRAYVDTGQVRFYMMDLPLEIHQNAMIAAEAAHCAAKESKFWPMHDRLQNASSLELESLVSYGVELGLSPETFRECIASSRMKDLVQQSAKLANERGIRATPSFVIGKSTPSGVEGQLVIGAVPFSNFEKALKDSSK